MEAVLLQSATQNQHISPYNRSHAPNPKRTINGNYSFISGPAAFAAENLLPPSNNNIHAGLLQTPPNLSFSHSSLPPYFPAYGNSGNVINHLPLARGFSLPHPISHRSKPSNNNNNSRRSSKDSYLNTAKKSKASANNSPKKEDKSKKPTKVVATKAAEATSGMVKSSTESLGPDPKDLPKVVSSLSSSSSMAPSNSSISSVSSSVKKEAIDGHGDNHQMDVFTGSVMFTPSPPPSSLPLPTFSLRPKLSCNAEAAADTVPGGGVDAGATDNLRRLLRLR